MEDSQLICAYLDNLNGKPRFHNLLGDPDWASLRLEYGAQHVRRHFGMDTRNESAHERAFAHRPRS